MPGHDDTCRCVTWRRCAVVQEFQTAAAQPLACHRLTCQDSILCGKPSNMTKFACVLLLLALAAVSVPAQAARDETALGPDAKHAAEAAMNEAASPFISLIKMMMGGFNGDPATVAELAEHAPRNVSMVIDGVERAGLHTAIADPNFQATIFAPTNWAFEVALVKLKITPAQLWTDKTALTNLLSYHTVLGKTLAAGDLHDGMKLTTASQHELTVRVDKVDGTSIQPDSGGDPAKVLAADIRAGKAIIHVIDTVLVPPKPST